MADEHVTVHLIPKSTSKTKLTGRPDRKQQIDYAPDVTEFAELDKFRKDEAALKSMPARLRTFYEHQNEQIDAYAVAQSIKEKGQGEGGDEEEEGGNFAVTWSFRINILLFGIKIFAAIWSLSLSIIASATDSFLDLFSGSILWYTARAMDKKNPYKYPQGKSRLEPVGIMVFACVMGMAALYLCIESLQILIEGITSGSHNKIRMDAVGITVLCTTIVVKLCLCLYCRHVASKGIFPSVEALAQDHSNDVKTNSIALAASLLAYQFDIVWFLDPVGAIVLGIYIVKNWVGTGKGQIQYLVGKTAPPEFLAQITYLSAQHDKRILRVDTVLAYHFGIKYLAEVHIALSGDLTLREAHDIGESLESAIEKLELVERAFVHLDYEWTHKPEYFRRQKKKDGGGGAGGSVPVTPMDSDPTEGKHFPVEEVMLVQVAEPDFAQTPTKAAVDATQT